MFFRCAESEEPPSFVTSRITAWTVAMPAMAMAAQKVAPLVEKSIAKYLRAAEAGRSACCGGQRRRRRPCYKSRLSSAELVEKAPWVFAWPRRGSWIPVEEN